LHPGRNMLWNRDTPSAPLKTPLIAISSFVLPLSFLCLPYFGYHSRDNIIPREITTKTITCDTIAQPHFFCCLIFDAHYLGHMDGNKQPVEERR
jgi:hypothetical protein